MSDEEVKKVFAENMRHAMQLRGVSQATLSRITKESEARLSHYRNGLKIPGIGVATRIAEALETTLDELLKPQKNTQRKNNLRKSQKVS